MKLSLLLISLACLPLMATTCNPGKKDSQTQMQSDTLISTIDTLQNALDTNIARQDNLSTSAVDTIPVDSLPKSTKYGTQGEKKEAPKHDSPNQAKIDSIKAAKKKTKD